MRGRERIGSTATTLTQWRNVAKSGQTWHALPQFLAVLIETGFAVKCNTDCFTHECVPAALSAKTSRTVSRLSRAFQPLALNDSLILNLLPHSQDNSPHSSSESTAAAFSKSRLQNRVYFWTPRAETRDKNLCCHG